MNLNVEFAGTRVSFFFFLCESKGVARVCRKRVCARVIFDFMDALRVIVYYVNRIYIYSNLHDLVATIERTNERPKWKPIFINAQLFYWVALNISLTRVNIIIITASSVSRWVAQVHASVFVRASANACVLEANSCFLCSRCNNHR